MPRSPLRAPSRFAAPSLVALCVASCPRPAWSQAVPAGAAPVTLHAVSRGPEFRAVSVGDRTCALPCSLSVAPGLRPVTVTGDWVLFRHLDVPAAGATLRIRRPRDPLLIAGAVLTAAGLVVGASLWSAAPACPRGDCYLAIRITMPVAGGLMFFTGLGFVLERARHPRFTWELTPL